MWETGGADDLLPAWSQEMATRKQLWQEYGLTVGEWSVLDVLRAIRFSNAFNKRVAYLRNQM